MKNITLQKNSFFKGVMIFVMQNISSFALFAIFREQNVFFQNQELVLFLQTICHKSIIFRPILLKFLLQPPSVFSSTYQERCCPRNNFSPSKKIFSQHTPNFWKIIVLPFLKVFGIKMADFMPQTFRKKSGTLPSNYKTNSGFHLLNDHANLSSIFD